MNTQSLADFEVEFDRAIAIDDGAATRAILASGLSFHIARDDNPAGDVIRVHPDGREELVKIDREAAAQILGR